MELLITILAIVGVPAGLYLLGSFLVMRAGGDIHELEIAGFQVQKDKGRALPIVRFEDAEAGVKLVEVRKIEQISYLLSPPIERQMIEIVGADGASPWVYGYLRLVTGVVALLPGLVALGLHLERAWFTGQVVYILILMGMMLGGWAALKIIQRL